ncbi:hypothetical protein O166_20575 [Pseudogulbenkiania ferrooxidans EGD-HP2]|uniref:Uncharacterized protein n=1 Tax=Pseudogulbenkiania ferrooxidans EGD-HP2 TaxID=1388764 RepID=A0ABP2XTH3_9NEIS|nr:hypothetical protein O166_20575 [Pseudogulbenkiania ferrooxidans EGD-HP2]
MIFHFIFFKERSHHLHPQAFPAIFNTMKFPENWKNSLFFQKSSKRDNFSAALA